MTVAQLRERVNAVDRPGWDWDRSAISDTPAFREFFGASKVVDKDGEPLPVFHGTADDFSVFGHERAGESTGHATSPLGHFFTPDRAQADGYARNASDGRPADERVVDAYLRIEKPYTMRLDQAQSIETPGRGNPLRRIACGVFRSCAEPALCATSAQAVRDRDAAHRTATTLPGACLAWS